MNDIKQNKRTERLKLIKKIDTTSFPEAKIASQFAEVIASCIEDTEDALTKSSEASTTLGKRIWWLNFFIAIATFLGVCISGIALYLKITNKI